jgi:hypothetical protein
MARFAIQSIANLSEKRQTYNIMKKHYFLFATICVLTPLVNTPGPVDAQPRGGTRGGNSVRQVNRTTRTTRASRATTTRRRSTARRTTTRRTAGNVRTTTQSMESNEVELFPGFEANTGPASASNSGTTSGTGDLVTNVRRMAPVHTGHPTFTELVRMGYIPREQVTQKGSFNIAAYSRSAPPVTNGAVDPATGMPQ